mmetsp:Transcript_34416/g.90888  ORF Transcript_34416/g.90888 Transcript_34416/m.90888 type:complete len:94 (-) Transcript_34416:64-345(-)
MSHNGLGKEACVRVVKGLERLPGLSSLNLSYNKQLHGIGGAWLQTAFAGLSPLTRLDMRCNGLGEEGCLALVQGLESLSSLASLDIRKRFIEA